VSQERGEAVLNKGQTKGIDPAVRSVIDRLKTFSPEDRSEFLELLLQVQEMDDPEEYESLVRAIEEIWEQAPVVAEPFSADTQPVSERLKKWTTHVAVRIRELREKAEMSVAALAEAADLPPDYVSLIEEAQESASNLALSKIASALHVDVGAIDPIAD
jgi:hypothetical protein